MYEYGGEYEELVYCGVRTARAAAGRCRPPYDGGVPYRFCLSV